MEADGIAGAEHDPRAGLPPTGRWPKALGSYLVTLFVLITLNFFLPRAMPGDPIDALLAESSSQRLRGEESRRVLAEYYDLDGSLLSQYRSYLGQLAHGDLGRSIQTLRPVREEIGRRLPWTLLLVGSSLLLATAIGVVAGIRSGWKRDRPLDRGVLTALLAVREFPTFLLASLLLFVFSVKLRWVPLDGEADPFATLSLFGRAVDIGSRLVLPLLVLTLGLMVGTFLLMRAGMVSELGADYLLLGRAKGVTDGRLKYRYAARNALLPVVSLGALQLGFVVTGDVLVERVFSYPGLGSLLVGALGSRDYPVIQGAFLMISVTVVTANALADALYRRLDPRTAP